MHRQWNANAPSLLVSTTKRIHHTSRTRTRLMMATAAIHTIDLIMSALPAPLDSTTTMGLLLVLSVLIHPVICPMFFLRTSSWNPFIKWRHHWTLVRCTVFRDIEGTLGWGVPHQPLRWPRRVGCVVCAETELSAITSTPSRANRARLSSDETPQKDSLVECLSLTQWTKHVVHSLFLDCFHYSSVSRN